MDNRSETRFAEEIRFFVQVNECPANQDLVGASVACEAVDFSTHGLQFCADTQLPVESSLDITIGIGQPFAMYLLSGEIRWVRDVKDKWYMGTLLHASESTDYRNWCAHFDDLFS